MEQTLIKHPKLSVRRVTGSEGPRHDPYSYEELHADVLGNEIVLHQGLGTWLTINGTKVTQPERMTHDLYEKTCRDIFEKFVGFTTTQLERIYTKRMSRCKCGSKSFTSVRGFPGEHLIVCDHCGDIKTDYFCMSEIE